MRFALTILGVALLFVAVCLALSRLIGAGDWALLFAVSWSLIGLLLIVNIVRAWLQNRSNWRGETSYYVPDQGKKALVALVVYPLTLAGGYFLVDVLT